MKARSGAQKAAIFRAHEAFLDDPDLLAAVARSIRGGQSAGWAWREEIERRAGELQKVDDPLLAARATDLGDVGNRVLAFLADVDDTDAELPGHPVVLVADDLTPSDTAAIDPARVVGFCTAAGGPTSHTAIIARALGIPAIVGAGPAALAQPAGVVAVLDGSGGTLWLDLDDADLESAQRVQEDLEDVRAGEHRTRYEPAITHRRLPGRDRRQRQPPGRGGRRRRGRRRGRRADAHRVPLPRTRRAAERGRAVRGASPRWSASSTGCR